MLLVDICAAETQNWYALHKLEGQRNIQLTREVSGSNSRGAHTHHVFIILRLISTLLFPTRRNRLVLVPVLVPVLLSVASSSCSTWKKCS